MLSEQARVLITVKASPEPSEKYGDTVCVAPWMLTYHERVSDKAQWLHERVPHYGH